MGSAEALAGLSLIDLKRYDEAEKQFQQAVNINQSPEVLALLAISQFCQSFDKSALPNTDFALAEDLSLSSFTFDLKAKVKNQEKLTLANSTISKALKLNPEFPIGNYIKGIIEYYSGTESCKYWELATTQKYTVPLSFMKKCSK